MDNHEIAKRHADVFAESIILMGLFLLLMSLTSCRSVRYVPVERVLAEYHNHTDTVKQTDSVIIEKETIIREADSTLLAKLGLKLKENEKAILILKMELEKQKREVSEHKTDTVIVRDSIPVPYKVEKELTWYQEKCITWFPWILFAAIVFLTIIIKPWRWLKRI